MRRRETGTADDDPANEWKLLPEARIEAAGRVFDTHIIEKAKNGRRAMAKPILEKSAFHAICF